MERERWATRLGFILAAVGSAVGLGNIWRFPYITGQEGGAAFLLVYLLFILIIGLPAILLEFVVGRRTDRNPVGALKQLATGPFRYIGYVFVVTGFVILSYYSVVAGWTIRYTLIGITDGYSDAVGRYDTAAAETENTSAADLLFADVATGTEAMIFHAIFMAIVIFIVGLGIRRGIELAVKLMVPAVIAITAVLVGYAYTLDGATEGYEFYLSPDFGVIASDWTSILPAAAGQAFFTLSLGMGVMITYASYIDEDRNLAKDSAAIIGLDTLIAFIIGLVIFPVLFTAGVSPDETGFSALFVGLTEAFADVSGGRLLGTIFFFVVAIGALSSAISILEVVVSYTVDELGVERMRASAGAGGLIFLLGLLSAYDLVLLDFFDLLVDGVLLVLGALLLAAFIGWQQSDFAIDELGKGVKDLGDWGTTWIWMIRIPVLIVLVVSLVLGILDYWEFLTEDFSAWLDI